MHKHAHIQAHIHTHTPMLLHIHMHTCTHTSQEHSCTHHLLSFILLDHNFLSCPPATTFGPLVYLYLSVWIDALSLHRVKSKLRIVVHVSPKSSSRFWVYNYFSQRHRKGSILQEEQIKGGRFKVVFWQRKFTRHKTLVNLQTNVMELQKNRQDEDHEGFVSSMLWKQGSLSLTIFPFFHPSISWWLLTLIYIFSVGSDKATLSSKHHFMFPQSFT